MSNLTCKNNKISRIQLPNNRPRSEPNKLGYIRVKMNKAKVHIIMVKITSPYILAQFPSHFTNYFFPIYKLPLHYFHAPVQTGEPSTPN